LAPTKILDSRKKQTVSKLNRNSKLFKTIINAILDKKGESVVSIDLRKVNEAVADFFIVCQASTNTQVRAIAENVEHEVRDQCGERPYRHEGWQAQQWVLIDFVNVVVHVMQPEPRKFYKLEEMWSDGDLKTHE
jgi:ribosome-associated protein